MPADPEWVNTKLIVRKIAAVIDMPENDTANDEKVPIARSSSCS